MTHILMTHIQNLSCTKDSHTNDSHTKDSHTNASRSNDSHDSHRNDTEHDMFESERAVSFVCESFESWNSLSFNHVSHLTLHLSYLHIAGIRFRLTGTWLVLWFRYIIRTIRMREPSTSLVFKHMGHSSLVHSWEAFTLDLHTNDFCCDFGAWFVCVSRPNSLILIYAGHSTVSFIHVRIFYFKHLSYSYLWDIYFRLSNSYMWVIRLSHSYMWEIYFKKLSHIHTCELFTSKSFTFIHMDHSTFSHSYMWGGDGRWGKKHKLFPWYSVQGPGRMTKTPQAGTGDSVSRFRRYHCSTVINSYFLVGEQICLQLLFMS